jgi:hypothetical protein
MGKSDALLLQEYINAAIERYCSTGGAPLQLLHRVAALVLLAAAEPLVQKVNDQARYAPEDLDGLPELLDIGAHRRGHN